jgi:hypothetical protein
MFDFNIAKIIIQEGNIWWNNQKERYEISNGEGNGILNKEELKELRGFISLCLGRLNRILKIEEITEKEIESPKAVLKEGISIEELKDSFEGLLKKELENRIEDIDKDKLKDNIVYLTEKVKNLEKELNIRDHELVDEIERKMKLKITVSDLEMQNSRLKNEIEAIKAMNPDLNKKY